MNIGLIFKFLIKSLDLMIRLLGAGAIFELSLSENIWLTYEKVEVIMLIEF